MSQAVLDNQIISEYAWALPVTNLDLGQHFFNPQISPALPTSYHPSNAQESTFVFRINIEPGAEVYGTAVSTYGATGIPPLPAVFAKWRQSLGTLHHGWLGDGSVPPSDEVIGKIEAAANELQSVNFDVAIAALPDGGAYLEWYRDGDKLAAEVEPGGSLYMYRISNGAISDQEIEYDERILVTFLRSGRFE